MRTFWTTTVAAGAAALAATAASAGEKLTVYTALEADQYPAYLESFKAAHPDIDLEIVRDSTGIVTAKLLAEKANPVADVVWGLAATSLMLLDAEDLLMPYAPAGLDAIKPNMRDSADTPSWVGMDVWSSAICFNTVEAAKKNVPAPASWQDLTKPAYKGHLVMPNPASSGTGYLMVSAWLQIMGEADGWAFMDALHQNIATYTHSGSKPCKQAAAGEFTVGLSFEYRANKSKKEGAPLDIILPSEGLGWDMEAVGIISATDAPEAAKTFADWAVSEEAMRLYAENFAIVAMPGVQKPLEFVPATIEDMLIDNDFAWAAENRERILSEWSKRYDGKSEPKS
ncbi:MAG: putative 2-aminoethylphosphonate ABC transporter substrate-binding protein [Alphaproteobacteria bacterium]|nr:putative 2-aminoethylphosphonate ABC transporter substrate-binding protein [Alphaproteobacteria bacterium]